TTLSATSATAALIDLERRGGRATGPSVPASSTAAALPASVVLRARSAPPVATRVLPGRGSANIAGSTRVAATSVRPADDGAGALVVSRASIALSISPASFQRTRG